MSDYRKRRTKGKPDFPVIDEGLQPPSDISAEYALLGLMASDPEVAAAAKALVGDESFYLDSHQRAFNVIIDALDTETSTSDPVILEDRFAKAEIDVDNIHDFTFNMVCGVIPDVDAAEHMALIIAGLAERRRAFNAARNIIACAVDRSKSIDGWEAELERATATPSNHGLNVVCAKDVEVKPLTWLWQSRIPGGKLTILSSNPGVGKTFMTCDMASRVTRGALWPDGNGYAPKGSVLWLNSEDGANDILVPRLISAEADLSRIHIIKGVPQQDSNGRAVERQVRFDIDVGKLRRFLKTHPDIRLLVVDPISAYMGDIDSHKNADVRAVLGPLCDMADQNDLTIIGVNHLNKNGAGPIITRTMGSIGFVAQARGVWAHVPDAADPERFLWLPVKLNLCKKPSGLAYRIVDPGRIEWEEGEVTTTADEAMTANTTLPKRNKLDEAKAWLRQELSHGRWVPSEEVGDRVKEAGIAWRTYLRAKDELNVQSRKEKGKCGVWEILLPPEECHPNKIDGKVGTLGNVGKVTEGEECQLVQQCQDFQGSHAPSDSWDESLPAWDEEAYR